MAAEVEDSAAGPIARTFCGPPMRLRPQTPARNRHYDDRIARNRKVINITTAIAGTVSASFSVVQLVTEHGIWRIAGINIVAAAIFAGVPLLHRFGGLVAPLTLIVTSYVSLSVVTWNIGTGAGLEFYFLVAATVAVLVMGIEHIVLACTLVAIGAAIVITLQFTVPFDTGLGPAWALNLGFIVSTISACVMAVATVWYALREIERAEEAMEDEYNRSESLLANILPASIANRLKNPATTIIAAKYDDASVLFADIAGYTERASQSTPADLVEFLNRLYTEFDRLVEKHGLEKIKTSGDCYIVVSGVPEPRHDQKAQRRGGVAALATPLKQITAFRSANSGYDVHAGSSPVGWLALPKQKRAPADFHRSTCCSTFLAGDLARSWAPRERLLVCLDKPPRLASDRRGPGAHHASSSH